MPYETCGKQVLRDGEDFAQARDNASAVLIADALNAWDVDDPVMPELQTTTHAVRREGDEYVCRCGVRWPADEGIEHP